MSSQLPISIQSVVAVGEKVMASRLMDEVVILDLKSGVYHGLEAVGARVWEMIHQPAPVRSVRDLLLDEYEVEPARCESDLLAFLEELKTHGLLDVRSAAMEQVQPTERPGAMPADSGADDGGNGSHRPVDAAVSVGAGDEQSTRQSPIGALAAQ